MAGATAVIIGAGGGLGAALVSRFKAETEITRIIAVSRQAASADSLTAAGKLRRLQCDNSETAIAASCEGISELGGSISRVCICNGILHTAEIWPEKRLEELDAAALTQLFTVNTVIPMLWLKSLLPLLSGTRPCVVSVFNARIGSIGDNRLGGWYSYRASKAALNMLLKTAAIEFARRARNVKLISFHPGTTDTALSRPFQHSVEKNKLLTADFVAGCLLDIMNRQQADGQLSYIDWEDKTITW